MNISKDMQLYDLVQVVDVFILYFSMITLPVHAPLCVSFYTYVRLLRTCSCPLNCPVEHFLLGLSSS